VTLTKTGTKAIEEFHTELTDRLDGLLADLPAPERVRFSKTLARVVADVPAVF
jgi:DNA-binding MarR family transcriptional regulator